MSRFVDPVSHTDTLPTRLQRLLERGICKPSMSI